MPLSDYVLFRLARRWPSPAAGAIARLGAEPGTDAYQLAYSQDQFNQKVRHGIQMSVNGLDVLEIGCGHGGICCFLAVAGARSVVGIDLDPERLKYAEQFAKKTAQDLGLEKLPVTLLEMSACPMTFPDASFDLIVADKVFEHFSDPEAVMAESYRVLRPGGRLLVPLFSSIYSKHGLHLKHGLKMPWANLFFSEKSIIRAMHRLAAANPKLNELYPGLNDSPERVRDLRRYKDLNDITHKKFRQMAGRCGFAVEWFRPSATRVGRVIGKMPVLKRTLLADIFSTGASACLTKPAE